MEQQENKYDNPLAEREAVAPQEPQAIDNFLKDVVKPAFIHIFPYSRRAGTPAASRKDQVQDSVKTTRVQMLEELCAKLHEEFIEANRGVSEKVLFESTDRNGMMEGYTGNYIRISRPYDPELIGTIVDVVI